MKRYITFIDESGNTGKNLLDSQQPLFVISAVSVPQDKSAEAGQMLESHFQSAKEKEEIEIKAANWYKAPKKQEEMTLLLQELQTIGAQIHLVVLEKRFMIAGWAVDTFFDYANNGSEDISFVNDINKRKNVASYYEQCCTNADITTIGNALIKPSREAYLKAIDILQRNAPGESCIKMMEYAKNNVDHILEEETAPSGSFSESVFHSPNLTCFHTLGNMIASMCKSDNAQTTLIFDDCTLCNQAFGELFNTFTQQERDFDLLGNTIYTWKNRILNITNAKSHEEKLLQAADIMATCADKLMQKIQKGHKDFTPFENSILMQLRILFEDNHIWLVISPKLRHRFLNATNRYKI